MEGSDGSELTPWRLPDAPCVLPAPSAHLSHRGHGCKARSGRRGVGGHGNPLMELNLSQTPALKFLDCRRSQLTELDLSHLPGLTHLYCNNPREHPSRSRNMRNLDSVSNRLTTLNLSNVPALKELECRNNEIRELDVRGNPLLKTLYCDPSVKIIKHD
jgi:Leucine-rich repeat (LRR) protein